MMTNYSLTVRNIKNYNDFEKLCATLNEFDLIGYVFEKGSYFKKEKEAIFGTWEPQMWQNGNGQMVIISEKHPTFTFELTCGHDDVFWRIYYKDGTTEMCDGTVVFEKPRKIEWETLLAF